MIQIDHQPNTGVELEARRRLARLPIDQPPGLVARFTAAVSRRMLGQVPDNAWVMGRNRKVLFAAMAFERRVAGFDALDPGLKDLAVMAAAQAAGCSWCVDFGYFMAHRGDRDVAKLREVERWETSTVLSGLERQVIAYAFAASATPVEVTDAMVADLREALGDAALVELTMMIAIENQRSRFNSALGLVSQGFSAVCRLPEAP